MRGCFAAEDEGALAHYVRAVFEKYRGELADISQDEVLRQIVDRVGLDRDEFFRKIALPDTKKRLRENTNELIARGGFGSPTLFVNGDDMYFGNDRLPLVREALRRCTI